MTNKIALISPLYGYPSNYETSFYKNAREYFKDEEIHIVTNPSVIEGSYYYKFYYYKLIDILSYLEKNIQGNFEFVLFLDALDTNFIKPPIDIIDKFKLLNCSIIMGAEKNLWPPTNFSNLYEKKPIITDYKYLNSGTYFGYTRKIIEHLKEIVEKEYIHDDQGAWTIQYLLHDDIMIDQKSDFFFSTLDSKDKIFISDEKITLIGVDPYIIHDNGPQTENTIKLAPLINKLYGY